MKDDDRKEAEEDDDDGPVPAEVNFDIPLQASISAIEVKQDQSQIARRPKNKQNSSFRINRRARRGGCRAVTKPAVIEHSSDDDDDDGEAGYQRQKSSSEHQGEEGTPSPPNLATQAVVKESLEMSSEGENRTDLGNNQSEQNVSMSCSPTEDNTENVVINSNGGKRCAAKRNKLGLVNPAAGKVLAGKIGSYEQPSAVSSSFIEFPSLELSQAPVTAQKITKNLAIKQLGRTGAGKVFSNQNETSSRDISPYVLKPSIAVTNKERAQLALIEENIAKELQTGSFLNDKLLKSLAQHIQICHPEVLVEIHDGEVVDGEIKKRGRKSTKQRAREMVRNMKTPLSEIQFTISFNVPSEYVTALNRASNSRQSSTSKHNEFESMISEAKTRNMRKKMQEITASVPQKSQSLQWQRSAEKQLEEAAAVTADKPVALAPVGEPVMPSSDTQQCLLNLTLDMNVQKLLQVANDTGNSASTALAAELPATSAGTTKRSSKRTAAATVATVASGSKSRPGLVSNVTISADK